jgi:hypothetical protein
MELTFLSVVAALSFLNCYIVIGYHSLSVGLVLIFFLRMSGSGILIILLTGPSLLSGFVISYSVVYAFSGSFVCDCYV